VLAKRRDLGNHQLPYIRKRKRPGGRKERWGESTPRGTKIRFPKKKQRGGRKKRKRGKGLGTSSVRFGVTTKNLEKTHYSKERKDSRKDFNVNIEKEKRPARGGA